MSVLIKTMTNLPEHCYDCPCHDGESGYCQADKERRYSDYRPFWCPLISQETVTEFADRCSECGRENVLDKIRAEIFNACSDSYHMPIHKLSCEEIFEIIDKYSAESEEKTWN